MSAQVKAALAEIARREKVVLTAIETSNRDEGVWTYYSGQVWIGDVGEAMAAFDADTESDLGWPYADASGRSVGYSQPFCGDPEEPIFAEFSATADPAWALNVLRGDRATLEQHYPNGGQYTGMCICSSYSRAMRWPCPDAARVLNRYAPEDPS